jgi:hypothetical protein
MVCSLPRYQFVGPFLGANQHINEHQIGYMAIGVGL